VQSGFFASCLAGASGATGASTFPKLFTRRALRGKLPKTVVHGEEKQDGARSPGLGVGVRAGGHAPSNIGAGCSSGQVGIAGDCVGELVRVVTDLDGPREPVCLCFLTA